MPDSKRYSPAKSMADARHAIVKKLKQMKRDAITKEWQSTVEALDELEEFVRAMDERALTRKGGVVRPRRPLRRISK